MITPALEWLYGRLKRAPGVPQDVSDEAVCLGFTIESLDSARRVLNVTTEVQKAANGDYVYDVWTLPPNAKWPPTPYALASEALRAPLPTIKSATEVPDAKVAEKPVKSDKTSKKLDPKIAVEAARAALQRSSPRFARYLRQLGEIASDDAEMCPQCKRGTPRSEEIRLKAILAIMDRAGLTAPRAGAELGGDSGPAIIFPPGTQIAIMAGPAQQRAVVLPTLTRADQYEEVEQ